MTPINYKKCGINAKPQYFAELLASKPPFELLEFHSENYFHHSLNYKYLGDLRQIYDFSFHGVGLSLGSANGISQTHLQKLKKLIDEFSPILISEHLSFSGINGVFTPDLLPIPLNSEALEIFTNNITEFQNFIGRQILIENPSLYIALKHDEYRLDEFLNILCQKTGCGILLDVNNLEVCRQNIGHNPFDIINGIIGNVHEIHLAGYEIKQISGGKTIFIDTHGNKTYPKVWDLYHAAIQKFGDVQTIVEWDNDIPPLSELITETIKANEIKHKVLNHEIA